MELGDLQKYFEDAKSYQIGFKGLCHDCGAEVCVEVSAREDDTLAVTGGALYHPQIGQTQEDTKLFLKCDDCYKKNPELGNFMPCETYSRVVGYLRPTSQWNVGKQEEFKLRKMIKGAGIG